MLNAATDDAVIDTVVTVAVALHFQHRIITNFLAVVQVQVSKADLHLVPVWIICLLCCPFFLAVHGAVRSAWNNLTYRPQRALPFSTINNDRTPFIESECLLS